MGSSNHFVVSLDAPTVRNLVFSGDGNVYIDSFKGRSDSIFKYIDDVKIHVEIDFDLKNDTWNVNIDDKQLFSDVINGTLLRSICFTYSAVTADKVDFNATTYIDNI